MMEHLFLTASAGFVYPLRSFRAELFVVLMCRLSFMSHNYFMIFKSSGLYWQLSRKIFFSKKPECIFATVKNASRT